MGGVGSTGTDQPGRFPIHAGQAGGVRVASEDASSLVDVVGWQQLLGGADWREELTRRQDDDVLARLRKWTNRGRPLGSDRFVGKLERLLGRRLRPLPVGRPRKKTTKPKKPKAKSRK